MRVISQRSLENYYDFPYEPIAFGVEPSDNDDDLPPGGYVIYAYGSGGYDYSMAFYNTKERAVKELDNLRTSATNFHKHFYQFTEE